MDIKIFWCRANKYYAQKWLKNLWKRPDSILIASCAVTDSAKRKFIKEIKQNIKKWKHIYLTWCWAFSENWKINENLFFKYYPSLFDLKEKITLLKENPEEKTKEDFKENLYTKHFTIVQFGCDSFCNFCITVKKRWTHKNKDIQDVITEIQEIEKKWIKEIVLTWINLWAWWLDSTKQKPNNIFPQYLKKILEYTNIPRIRLSSLGPEFINDKRYEILEDERILPHFHLSIQSWSDKILKLMWRNYSSKDVENIITNLRNLKKTVPVNIWADIIVWFPQETQKDFEQTLKLIKNYNITKLHSFIFSKHTIWDQVPASHFKWQLNYKTQKKRQTQLIKIWELNEKKLIKQTKWKNVKILIEQNNSGWSENYLKYETKRKLKSGEIFETIF